MVPPGDFRPGEGACKKAQIIMVIGVFIKYECEQAFS